jgi:hypothetical protein
LQDALDSKQDTISNGDLSIANTSGLQDALDSKQDSVINDTPSSETDGLMLNGQVGLIKVDTNFLYISVSDSDNTGYVWKKIGLSDFTS